MGGVCVCVNEPTGASPPAQVKDGRKDDGVVEVAQQAASKGEDRRQTAKDDGVKGASETLCGSGGKRGVSDTIGKAEESKSMPNISNGAKKAKGDSEEPRLIGTTTKVTRLGSGCRRKKKATGGVKGRWEDRGK